MPRQTLGERIAILEREIVGSFENINEKLDNHLATHREREKIFWYIIIALIGVIGSGLIK